MRSLVYSIGRLIVAFAFFASTGLAFASEPNGCGSGWSTFVVPDRIRLLGCDFKASCDLHDKCYSLCDKSLEGICEYRRCRVGGDLFGNRICSDDDKFKNLISAAQARRNSCDVSLGDEIRNRNPGKPGCRALGVLYRYAVKEWGDPNFAGFGTVDQPLAWKQPQREYNKALSDFLAKATDEELKKFADAADTSTPVVNLCGRLRYSDADGLQNLAPEDKNACQTPRK